MNYFTLKALKDFVLLWIAIPAKPAMGYWTFSLLSSAVIDRVTRRP